MYTRFEKLQCSGYDVSKHPLQISLSIRHIRETFGKGNNHSPTPSYPKGLWGLSLKRQNSSSQPPPSITNHTDSPHQLPFSWEIPLEAFPASKKVQMGQKTFRLQTALVLMSAFQSHFLCLGKWIHNPRYSSNTVSTMTQPFPKELSRLNFLSFSFQSTSILI